MILMSENKLNSVKEWGLDTYIITLFFQELHGIMHNFKKWHIQKYDSGIFFWK